MVATIFYLGCGVFSTGETNLVPTGLIFSYGTFHGTKPAVVVIKSENHHKQKKIIKFCYIYFTPLFF